MGKKRITTESGTDNASAGKVSAAPGKKKLAAGIFHIEATYNNTKILLTDQAGNAITWSSSGSLGFKGAKKGTPFPIVLNMSDKVIVGDSSNSFGSDWRDIASAAVRRRALYGCK